MISKPTVNLAAANKPAFLAGSHKAHAHAGALARDLAGQPLGAGPAAKARVAASGCLLCGITMRPPAVIVFGSRQLSGAAQLRTAGKSLGIVRWLAVPQRHEDVAATDLVGKEMRRGRHDRGVGGIRSHPVDTGEMKAADAARLVATRTGDVVQAPLEA